MLEAFKPEIPHGSTNCRPISGLMGCHATGEVDRHLREQAMTMNKIPVQHRTFLVADMQPDRPLVPPALTRLEMVNCPVLVVAGALDHSEVLRAADMLAEGIPGARKVIIERSGHVPSFERPDVFTPFLREF